MGQHTFIKPLDLELGHDLYPELLCHVDDKGITKKNSSLQVSKTLLDKTDLRHCRNFENFNCFYLYNKNKGCYSRYSKNDLKICIISLIEVVAQNDFDFLIELTDSRVLENIVRNFLQNPYIYNSKTPVFNKDYLVMQNGLYNLKTRMLEKWSPEVFISHSLPCDYNIHSEAPQFEKYLDSFCDGMVDRKEYLKSMCFSTLLSKTDLQVFFYFYGFGGSGKSTIGLVLEHIMGQESTISTTLKALNTDQFEIANLVGKKLIIISDTEKYSKDLSILKAYVGGDSLRARSMYTQGTQAISCEGMILIIGNDPLHSQDSSNAIFRRLRAFKSDNVPKKSYNLIKKNKGHFSGLLVEESSGIINWILSSSDEHVQRYIVDYQKNVPSFSEVFKETKYLISPMSRWLEEETISGEGSFVGFKNQKPTDEKEERYRKALYPAYCRWCERNGYTPLKHINFTEKLLSACPEAKKERKSSGVFIKGVVLQKKVFDLDYQKGSTLVVEKAEKGNSIPDSSVSSI